MAFLTREDYQRGITEENESSLERIRNYFQSIFEQEPQSLLENLENDIRPTTTDNSTADEEPGVRFQRPSQTRRPRRNARRNVRRNERYGFGFFCIRFILH